MRGSLGFPLQAGITTTESLVPIGVLCHDASEGRLYHQGRRLARWSDVTAAAPQGCRRRGISRRQRCGAAFFELQGAKQTPQTCPSTDLSASEPELIISNW